MKKLLLLFLIALITGCSSYSTYKEVYSEENIYPIYDIPTDFKSEETRNETFKKYSEGLGGKTIFIDPGHGGDHRNGKSLSGRVIEADVNLRVALFLKEYLEEAGADVIMSRESDETVELDERSEMANESEADLFVSIHHNAPGGDNQYWFNYTSTFYHATKFDYEYEPYEHTIAKFIQRDLSYVMRNPGGLGSFDGTYSDYLIYPGEGFSVLRKTEIPSVLVECSFYTNPFEEERLLVEEFNAIQAWGIFRGIGKFFLNTTPQIELDQSKSSLEGGTLYLTINLEDEEGIDFSSVKVFVDSSETDFELNKSSNEVKLSVENIAEGEHKIRVVCSNLFGIYSKPYEKKFLVRFTD